MTGKFYGIGVGPGDPEFMTVKAANLLGEIPVVCVPKAKEGQSSLAYRIAKGYLAPDAKVVELVMPMTEVQEKLTKAWQEAAKTILGYIIGGRDVAFLTLGDPSLYSTFSYVSQALRELAPWVDIKIIPGVSSFSAAAACAGISLAEGDEPLVILPTPRSQELSSDLLDQANLVLMKVSRDFDWLLTELGRNGRLGGATLVSRVGQHQEFITQDLASLAGQKIDYLSLIISKKG